MKLLIATRLLVLLATMSLVTASAIARSPALRTVRQASKTRMPCRVTSSPSTPALSSARDSLDYASESSDSGIALPLSSNPSDQHAVRQSFSEFRAAGHRPKELQRDVQLSSARERFWIPPKSEVSQPEKKAAKPEHCFWISPNV
eukprot:CAMPEP_0196720704 /NCGR_PEP_ID=MMETSP1091-20130531/3431_1 /TAXON_ID=302021 /ORGANISM="Rhodomonas sp., Strain CCMP768" /LENGTH=144 /DNA_ID=CAMNT_0042062009 /DNA_START=94 /DNA_END=528 /DNA_ORIENTATION=+